MPDIPQADLPALAAATEAAAAAYRDDPATQRDYLAALDAEHTAILYAKRAAQGKPAVPPDEERVRTLERLIGFGREELGVVPRPVNESSAALEQHLARDAGHELPASVAAVRAMLHEAGGETVTIYPPSSTGEGGEEGVCTCGPPTVARPSRRNRARRNRA